MEQKLKALWTKLNSDVNELWQKDKVFLVVFSAVIFTIKFRQLLLNLIINGSQALFNKTQVDSSADQKKEESDNSSAESLIKDAQQLSESNPPVGDDWYEKK